MERILKLPDFGPDDLKTTARMNYFMAAGFILSSLVFVVMALLFAPELARRRQPAGGKTARSFPRRFHGRPAVLVEDPAP